MAVVRRDHRGREGNEATIDFEPNYEAVGHLHPVVNTQPSEVRAVVDAVAAADPAPSAHRCVPRNQDQVTIDLAVSPDPDPETGPVGEFTSLITGVRGSCSLTYSSTGAVVRTGPDLRAAIASLSASDR